MSLADYAHLLETPPWVDRAACRDLPSDWFFPKRSGRYEDRGRKICAGCPVTAECLEWALAFPVHYDHGIFAGTTARERKAMRRKRAA